MKSFTLLITFSVIYLQFISCSKFLDKSKVINLALVEEHVKNLNGKLGGTEVCNVNDDCASNKCEDTGFWNECAKTAWETENWENLKKGSSAEKITPLQIYL